MVPTITVEFLEATTLPTPDTAATEGDTVTAITVTAQMAASSTGGHAGATPALPCTVATGKSLTPVPAAVSVRDTSSVQRASSLIPFPASVDAYRGLHVQGHRTLTPKPVGVRVQTRSPARKTSFSTK